MKTKVIIIFTFLCYGVIYTQHTFSICAIDTVTMEVGSAGATCLDIEREGYEAVIISDVIPGIGVIHTQSYWDPTNQINAQKQMLSGKTPIEIIDYLKSNDVSNNPAIRQYGVVGFHNDANQRSSAFTGSSCLNYKNHIIGSTYAIQGNILLGQKVLDSMQARFLKAPGTLADRLMEAMLGAKFVGADTRCTRDGFSSRSSFLRVAKMNDNPNSIYLDLRVPSVGGRLDPLDSLHNLYKQWKLNTGIQDAEVSSGINIHVDDYGLQILQLELIGQDSEYKIIDIKGNVIQSGFLTNARIAFQSKLASAIYILKISDAKHQKSYVQKFLKAK